MAMSKRLHVSLLLMFLLFLSGMTVTGLQARPLRYWLEVMSQNGMICSSDSYYLITVMGSGGGWSSSDSYALYTHIGTPGGIYWLFMEDENPTEPSIEETVISIEPKTLNLKSNGESPSVTCQIQLPSGYNAKDVDISTVKLHISGPDVLVVDDVLEINNVLVVNEAVVNGVLIVNGELVVTGDLVVNGELIVNGIVEVGGVIEINGIVEVNGILEIGGLDDVEVVGGYEVPAQLKPTSAGNKLMVKFDRQAVINYLAGQTGKITLTVTGALNDGILFGGGDTITVI